MVTNMIITKEPLIRNSFLEVHSVAMHFNFTYPKSLKRAKKSMLLFLFSVGLSIFYVRFFSRTKCTESLVENYASNGWTFRLEYFFFISWFALKIVLITLIKSYLLTVLHIMFPHCVITRILYC